jgi:hypothetical protein
MIAVKECRFEKIDGVGISNLVSGECVPFKGKGMKVLLGENSLITDVVDGKKGLYA